MDLRAWNEDRKVLESLKKELQRRKVPDYMYNLRLKGRHDERFSIVHLDDGRWEVYYEERGVRTTDMFFDSAQEACRYMIFELSNLS